MKGDVATYSEISEKFGGGQRRNNILKLADWGQKIHLLTEMQDIKGSHVGWDNK